MERKNYSALKLKIMRLLITILFFLIITIGAYGSENTNRIIILVNDNVITEYDIEQRAKIFAIINQVQITPENSANITSQIIDDLIDSHLKTEKIQEYDLNIDSSDFNSYENRYFRSLGIDKNHIFELMEINEVDRDELYNMLYNELAWQILISRLYYRITSVSDEEIEELINNDPEISNELAEQIIMDKQLSLRSNKMLRDLRDEATIEYK